jgi:hypothetical protein
MTEINANAKGPNDLLAVMARIADETGQPLTRVEPAAAPPAPARARRNRLVINGRRIA